MSNEDNLRIACVGGGALGGYVGAHLAKAGYDVVLIDQWPEHVNQISRTGLHFSGTLGDYTIPVQALQIHEVQRLVRRPIDIAFICTKLYDTAWATSLIKGYLSPTGFVVTLQNSLVEGVVAGIVGWGRTVGCIPHLGFGAEVQAPGRIIRTRRPVTGRHTFRVGEIHGRITPRVIKVVDMLNMVDSAGPTTNLWGERWSKLVANTMTGGVSGVTGVNLKTVLTHPALRILLINLAAEAINVGLAQGYEIEPVRGLLPEIWLKAKTGDSIAQAAVDGAIVDELKSMTDEGHSGISQDLRKGRRTEVDFMNGYVAVKAREIGIPAPTHESMAKLIKLAERGDIKPGLDHVLSLVGQEV